MSERPVKRQKPTYHSVTFRMEQELIDWIDSKVIEEIDLTRSNVIRKILRRARDEEESVKERSKQ